MGSKPPGTPRPRSAHSRASSFDASGKTASISRCPNGEGTNKSFTERKSGRAALTEDLIRAKRNVDELTVKLNGVNSSCKKEKVNVVAMEGAAPPDKDGWQLELEALKQHYELALLDLQTSKQAMVSLKHELMVCVEAKDEAVRLAGEAMSAAESTARRVEELSAELSTTKGSALVDDCATAGIDDLMRELPGDNLLGNEVPRRHILWEETSIPGGGRSKEWSAGEFLTTKPAEVNIEEDQGSQHLQENDVETKHDDLAVALKTLQRELASAKDAEQKAVTKILIIQSDMERASLEAEKAKNAESIAQVSLAKVCKDLEEAEQRLTKGSVAEATLTSSLESLNSELEKSRHEAMEALDREAMASTKVTELLQCMEKMRDSHQAELLMRKEKEASAHATIELLQKDLQAQKLELTIVADRELILRESHEAEVSLCNEKEASSCAMLESLQKDFTRQRSDVMNAVEKEAKIRESCQVELSMCKEREASACAMVESLQMDLEAESTMIAAKISEMIKELERSRTEMIEQQKHSSCEVAALSSKLEANQSKLAAIEERESCRITTLMADVDKKQAEVDNMQCWLTTMETEAQEESTELSRLREENLRLAELMLKEQESSAALKAKIVSLQQTLEESLHTGKAGNDNLGNVESSLQDAISERDQAKCDLQESYQEIELNQQMTEDVLMQARVAKDDAERAFHAQLEAYNAAKETWLASTRIVQEEAAMAREEADATKDKLEAALKTAETRSMELGKVMKEAQSAREDADLQRSELAIEKERSSCEEDEAKEVFGEVERLRAEVAELQAEAMAAVAAKEAAELGLQVAMGQHQSREKEEDKSQKEIAALKDTLSHNEENGGDSHRE